MRALVTGANGFVGTHLLALLLQVNAQVAALSRDRGLASQGPLQWLAVDVRDADGLSHAIGQSRPSVVIHLAGQSNAAPLADMFSTNVQGTLNLLEAVRCHVPEAMVLIAGSSAEYGTVPPEHQPISEDVPLHPITPYGVSKMAADLLGYHYSRTYGLRIVRVRPFNLIGPGQSEQFVCAAFARQLAEIKCDLREPVLRVGNLHTSRDLLDARDAARGFVLLAEHGGSGEAYNLCSGRETVIEDMLRQLIEISGLRVDVSVDPARLQQADVPAQIGSYAKIHRRTGWTPQISLEQTLADVWADWCARIAAERGHS